MTADGRLRKLHHRADLGDRQLVPLENQEHAAAGRVGQRAQVLEDGCFHSYIRIKRLTYDSAVFKRNNGELAPRPSLPAQPWLHPSGCRFRSVLDDVGATPRI